MRDTSVVVYIVVSMITIVVLLVLLVRKKHKDGFCICASGGDRRHVCQPDMAKAYRAGLTENSDFALLQKKAGGPRWNQINPGDYTYPKYEGNCGKFVNV